MSTPRPKTTAEVDAKLKEVEGDPELVDARSRHRVAVAGILYASSEALDPNRHAALWRGLRDAYPELGDAIQALHRATDDLARIEAERPPR